MELDELKQMSAADLAVKEREVREEAFRLRVKLRTNQLDNPANYKKARRELARIKTLITQKTTEASQAAPAMRERIKEREGVVVSAKMTKTVVVRVERLVRTSAVRQTDPAARALQGARREGRMPRGRPGVADRIAARCPRTSAGASAGY